MITATVMLVLIKPVMLKQCACPWSSLYRTDLDHQSPTEYCGSLMPLNSPKCKRFQRARYTVLEDWTYIVETTHGCLSRYTRAENEYQQMPEPQDICSAKHAHISISDKMFLVAESLHGWASVRYLYYTAGKCCQANYEIHDQIYCNNLIEPNTQCNLGTYEFAPTMGASPKKTAKCLACVVDFLQLKNIDPQKRTWHDYRMTGDCAFAWNCDEAEKRPMEYRYDSNEAEFEFVFKGSKPDFCAVDLRANISALKSNFHDNSLPANWAQIATKLINGISCYFTEDKFIDANSNDPDAKNGCYSCSLHGKLDKGNMLYKFGCHSSKSSVPKEEKQADVTVKVCFEKDLCNTPILCSTGMQALLTEPEKSQAKCMLCGSQLMRKKSAEEVEPYALGNLAVYSFCINELVCPDRLTSVQVLDYEAVGAGPVCFPTNPTSDEMLSKLLQPSYSDQFSSAFRYPAGFTCSVTSPMSPEVTSEEIWWNALVATNFTSFHRCGDCATVLWIPSARNVAPMYKQSCLRNLTCEQFREEQLSASPSRNLSGSVNVSCCHNASQCNRPPVPPTYNRECYVTSVNSGHVTLAQREGDSPPEFNPSTGAELREEAKLSLHRTCTLCARLNFENGRTDLACIYSEEAGWKASVTEHDCLAKFDRKAVEGRVGSRLVAAACSSDQFAPTSVVGLRCFLGNEFHPTVNTSDSNGVPLKACATLKKAGTQVTEYPAITTDAQCQEQEDKYSKDGSGEFACCRSHPVDEKPCNAEKQPVSKRYTCYKDETTIDGDCVACYVAMGPGRAVSELACFQSPDMVRCTATGHCCFGDRCNDPACFGKLKGRPCEIGFPHGDGSHSRSARPLTYFPLVFIAFLRSFFPEF